ncbi:MAG: hypothetical protein PSX81_04880 [bacterium]|nr:hypothetical protein [bacterium]
MNYKRVYWLLIFCFVCLQIRAVESIDDNGKSVFFLDKSKINQHDLSGFKFQRQLDLLSDTALINTFYRKYKCPYPLDFKLVKRRLSIANYDNINCFEDKIFVTARFLTLDSNRKRMEYIIIEYTADLKFKQLYLLYSSLLRNEGNAFLYPRFRLLFNNQNEVMFTTRFSLKSKSTDSMGSFAVYKMNAKSGELQFSRLLNVPKPIKDFIVQDFSLYPFGHIMYPISIPFNFSNSPAYFCFPYCIVRNFNGSKVMDPFHHVSYNRDSFLKHCYVDLKMTSLGQAFNRTPTRELVLAYSTNKDTLQLLVGNYQSQKNKLAIVEIIGKQIEITALKSEVDLASTYFQMINHKVLAIHEENGAYALNYID